MIKIVEYEKHFRVSQRVYISIVENYCKRITVSNQRDALLEIHRMYVIIFFISLCYHRDIILRY